MSNFIVFYGQQLYGEFTDMHADIRRNLPDGCVIRYPSKNWYIKMDGGGLTPINLCDIPPEVRVNCLLMGINI